MLRCQYFFQLDFDAFLRSFYPFLRAFSALLKAFGALLRISDKIQLWTNAVVSDKMAKLWKFEDYCISRTLYAVNFSICAVILCRRFGIFLATPAVRILSRKATISPRDMLLLRLKALYMMSLDSRDPVFPSASQ